MTLADILADLRQQTTENRHASTGTWVSSVLRERIAAGQLAPGTKLSEEALCDVLKVSRNTLREAFSTLSAERIVTRIPNRGVFVSRPTADDIREIYRARRYLELAAITWAPDHDLAALQVAVARARAAREEGSLSGMASANQDFHSGLVALARSEWLDRLMMQVLAEMRLVFHSMVEEPDFHTGYVEQNARIVELLEAGDRSQAVELLTGYLHAAEEQLLAASGAV